MSSPRDPRLPHAVRGVLLATGLGIGVCLVAVLLAFAFAAVLV